MKKEDKPEPTISCPQALNHFKLSGRNRRIAESRFKTSVLTISAWDVKLKSLKLL